MDGWISLSDAVDVEPVMEDVLLKGLVEELERLIEVALLPEKQPLGIAVINARCSIVSVR